MKLTSKGQPRSALIASHTYGAYTDGFEISQADRDKAASSGAAMPDGSYPIETCGGDNSVDTAISAVGRGSGSHDAIRKHIIARAKSLGCSSKIPENWNDDGSLTDAATAGRSVALAAPPPPPPAAKPAPDAQSTDDADGAVTTAIGEIKAAVDKAIEAQKTDPDTDDPKDEKVSSGLQSLSDAVGQLLQDQAADAAEPAAEPAKPPVTAAAPVVDVPAGDGAAKQPQVSPVDDQGNIANDAKCANPDCGHLGSAHVDTPDGANTGGCSMANCQCQGMAVESQPNSGSGDDQPDTGNQGAQPRSDTEELTHGAPVAAVPDAPVPPGPPSTNGSELNPPPPVEGGQPMGPAFTAYLIIEGQPTGDGRQIAPNALTWRVPPLPLMGLATETHDPEGFDQNDPAVICGRIDSLERQPGDGGTQIIVARGYYLPNDDGSYFAELNEKMGRLGISADVAVQASEIDVGEIDEDGWPSDMSEILTKGTIMAGTVCPMPAFEGAYIVLGDGATTTPIPATAEDQGVVTGETEPVTASIHFMAYESCEPCQQGLELIVASGGPAAPPAAWFEDPAFTDGDGRLVEILDRRGQRALGGKYACPLTVTDDGRVYGHLAPWGVCHIGKPGCVTAPQSKSGYAYFKRGQHVVTAEGEKIRVGALTVNAGHADIHASPTSAMAHYDNIATTAAFVNCGEDEYGIWLAGALSPGATPDQVTALRAASVSGDWRALGGHLELVAALAVPVPGFPHAVVAGGEEALVASGASVMHRLKHPLEAPQPTAEDYLRAFSPVLSKMARQDARDGVAALRT